jgi:hypothetical protein
MSFYEQIQKKMALDWLYQNCQDYEVEHAQAAFDGDEDDAFSLSVALNNGRRGDVAVAMWRAKVPKEAFRAYLASVWDYDHRYVIGAAGTRRTLAYMFRYAAFPLPTELPDVVTVWRGTSYLPIGEARTGYSWTTDRDMACWFAMRFADRNGSPLLLTADIAKKDIALFHDGRNESEAMLIRSPTTVAIDGDASNWTACFQRKKDAMNRERTAYLDKPRTMTA